MEDKKIREFIVKELLKFEFKRCTKGYKYLTETIFICIKNNDNMDNLTKNVFTKLAKKYNEKTFFNIKWCIEQSLKTMFNNTKISIVSEYFNLDENLKPSLKFFVYTIVCNYYNSKI